MTTLRPELLDELLTDYEKPDDLLGEEGLFTRSAGRFFAPHASQTLRSGAGGCLPHLRHRPWARRSAVRRS